MWRKVGLAVVALVAVIIVTPAASGTAALTKCHDKMEISQDCLRSQHCYLRHVNYWITTYRRNVEYRDSLEELCEMFGETPECARLRSFHASNARDLHWLLREKDRILDGGLPPTSISGCLDVVPPTPKAPIN